MEQQNKLLERLVTEKATIFWEASEKQLAFLEVMGYSTPERSIKGDSIFFRSIYLRYRRGMDRMVALSLAPASIVLDRDDAIVALIHKPRTGMARPKGGWTHFSLNSYIEAIHPELGSDYSRIPRVADYESAVRDILSIYARIMEVELKGMLLGQEWKEGYGVYMA